MNSVLEAPVRGIEAVHGRHVAGRRVRVLSRHLARLLPVDARVLDVGCGDGQIAWCVSQARPDVTVRGVEVLVRPDTKIEVEPFDGATLPYADGAFDCVMLVDVLHHCEEPLAMLAEAARVASQAVVVKDHRLSGVLAGPTLRLMDYVGNHRYGVSLPYNYLSPAEWQAGFDQLGLTVEERIDHLAIYPKPASWLFDRTLHFAARLGKRAAASPRVEPAAS